MLKIVILCIGLIAVCKAAVVDETAVNSRIYYTGICESNNCRYGTCEIYNTTAYKCHCTRLGITGEFCDQLDKTNDPCSSYPCYGDSVCYNLNGNFACVCSPGRTGPTCESHVGPCRCRNQGTCIQTAVGAFTCTCPTNYGGYLCEYYLPDFNTCRVKPCQNSGICLSTTGVCACPPGFTGKFCETAVATATTTTTTTTVATSFCQTVVCQNRGTCIAISATQGFCNCPTGFFGPLCEYDIPTSPGTTTTTTATTTTTTAGSSVVACPATLTLCKNNALCYIVNGASVLCVCQAGFTGTFCDTPLTTTTTTPAVTTTTTATTTTTTTTTTTPTTTPSVSVCSPVFASVCKNNAQCYLISSSIVCICTPGFTGTFCDAPIAGVTTTTTTTTTTATATATTTTTTPVATVPCSINICQNGGTCNIVNGGLVCTCPTNYEGVLCENKKPFCQNANVCKNNGICLNLGGSDGICYCQAGFYGVYCEATGCSPVNPCQNNHNCITRADGSPFCFCRTGYSGDYCEIVQTL